MKTISLKMKLYHRYSQLQKIFIGLYILSDKIKEKWNYQAEMEKTKKTWYLLVSKF